MAAVVVLEKDRGLLRDEIDGLVPAGWWHTTDQLRSDADREHARQLLQAFRVPDETCVIVDKVSVDDADKDGTQARGVVLGRLRDHLLVRSRVAGEDTGTIHGGRAGWRPG